MTRYEAYLTIEKLKMVFNMVRLVDVELANEYSIDEYGNFIKSPYKCYAVWKHGKRCDNCISARALIKKKKMTKYDFVDDTVYNVIAMYVEIEDESYIIEMITQITDEILFSAYGKNDFIDKIFKYNKKIYFDTLTGTYNRQYYEDQLKGLLNLRSVAMIDIDNFKQINDNFGHTVGDMVLKEAGLTISKAIDEDDVVVRYGGDEFLVVCQDNESDSFKNKLENIRVGINNIIIDGFDDICVTASVGGVYKVESGKEIIDEADKMLYVSKKNKNMTSVI